MSKPFITFEESIDIVNDEINKRRSRWTLSAIRWMDFDDLSQILRIHIHEKWHLWDQERPLRPWLHKVIINRIYNVTRNLYTNTSRPCLRCAAYEGENLCAIYTTQCADCPIYAEWNKSKKNAHDVKLPVSLEFHANEVSERPENSINVEKALGLLTGQMKKVLKPIEYEVYRFLYVDGGDEEGAARLLGFKTTEKGRQAGYRQMKNIKDSIINKAKKLIYSGEIDF